MIFELNEHKIRFSSLWLHEKLFRLFVGVAGDYIAIKVSPLDFFLLHS